MIQIKLKVPNNTSKDAIIPNNQFKILGNKFLKKLGFLKEEYNFDVLIEANRLYDIRLPYKLYLFQGIFKIIHLVY